MEGGREGERGGGVEREREREEEKERERDREALYMKRYCLSAVCEGYGGQPTCQGSLESHQVWCQRYEGTPVIRTTLMTEDLNKQVVCVCKILYRSSICIWRFGERGSSSSWVCELPDSQDSGTQVSLYVCVCV